MIDAYSTDSPPMPAPRLMARSMLSFGTEVFFAFSTASNSVGLPCRSGPPSLAATSMFLMSLAHDFARRESMTAFLCLVVAHLECPDMVLLYSRSSAGRIGPRHSARSPPTDNSIPAAQRVRDPRSRGAPGSGIHARIYAALEGELEAEPRRQQCDEVSRHLGEVGGRRCQRLGRADEGEVHGPLR